MSDDASPRVLAFAATLRRHRVRAAARDGALRAALVLALPAILGLWWLPQQAWLLGGGALVIAGLAGAAAGRRARRLADARLLRGETPGSAELAILGDELATWLECRREQRTLLPMAAWLSHDVAARLPAADEAALQRVGHRRLGRLRHLVPAIVLLLLAWLASFWLQPDWPGLLGGKAEPPGSRLGGAPGGTAMRGSASLPASEAPPRPQPPPSRPKADPQQPEVLPAPTPEPAAPAPLLNLPEQRHFVLPEHIDDGPTRRMRMHAAEVAAAGAAAPAPRSAGAGAGDLPAPPPPTRETFAAAQEQALRARHVPAGERAIVARFFALLQEAAK